MMTRTALVGFAVVLLAAGSKPRAQQAAPVATNLASLVSLVPTNHPRVPGVLSQLWLVPESRLGIRTQAETDFGSAVKL